MNSLQVWRLKRFCDQYRLDYQEIDHALTEAENKKHLRKLVIGKEPDMRKWKAQLAKHKKEHPLEEYIAASMQGRTTSELVGEPMKPRFSLAEFVRSRR